MPQAGDTQPPNDETIGDDVILYRRVPASPPYVKRSGSETRPSNLAFQNSKDENGELIPEMSVVLEDTLSEMGRDPETILGPGQEHWYIAQIRARDVRELEEAMLGVVRSQTTEEPAHGDVTGWLIEKSVRQAVAKIATWYRPPP